MQNRRYYRQDQTVFQLGEGLRFFILTLFIVLLQSACTQIKSTSLEPVQSILPVADSRQLPDVIKVLLNQSDVQYLNNDFNAALVTLERAIRIDPGHAEVWSRMAQVYVKKDQIEQARQHAKRSNSVVGNNTSLREFNNSIIDASHAQ